MIILIIIVIIIVIIIIMIIIIIITIIIDVLQCELLCDSLGSYCCVFPWVDKGVNKHQNNTQVSTWTARRKRTSIILFLKVHNEFINDHKINTSPCITPSVYHLITSQSIFDDVTMPNSCDTSKWTVLSNSFYIDFIDRDVHGRSWKNCMQEVWCNPRFQLVHTF